MGVILADILQTFASSPFPGEGGAAGVHNDILNTDNLSPADFTRGYSVNISNQLINSSNCEKPHQLLIKLFWILNF